MGFRERWINLFHRAATSTKKTRTLLTPVGVTIFFLFTALFVLAAVSFLEENEPHLKTIPDVLSLALMLESQALDLYLRFSDRVSDPLSKNALYKIADKENSHLSVVAKMLEKQF